MMVNQERILINGFNRADPTVFKQLYDQFYSPLKIFASRLTTNREEAEDIVIETFTKLFQLYPQFNDLPSIRAFLYITVRNSSFNYLKAQQRLQIKHKELRALMDDREMPIDEGIKIEVLQSVYAAVEKLPEGCKEVFKLIYFEDLTTAEIADRLGISKKTVLNQKRNAITILRTLVTENQLAIAWIIYIAIFKYRG